MERDSVQRSRARTRSPAPRPGYLRPPQSPGRRVTAVLLRMTSCGRGQSRGEERESPSGAVTSNSYHRPVSAAATLSLGTLSSFVICPGPGFLVFLRVAAPNNDYTDNGHPQSKYHITAWPGYGYCRLNEQ